MSQATMSLLNRQNPLYLQIISDKHIPNFSSANFSALKTAQKKTIPFDKVINIC